MKIKENDYRSGSVKYYSKSKKEPIETTQASVQNPEGLLSEKGISTLLYLGVFIFGTGLAVFVHSQWQSMSALVKFGILVSGSGVLFALGYWIREALKLPSTAIAFTTLGAFTLPVDVYAGVAFDLFPWDPYIIGTIVCPVFALFYAALGRRLVNELFVYGAVGSAVASVWFACRAAGLEPVLALTYLLYLPLAIFLLQRYMCTEKYITDDHLRQVYSRPLQWSAQAFMIVFTGFYVVLSLTPSSAVHLEFANRLMAHAAVILFYIVCAWQLQQAIILLPSLLFQYFLLQDFLATFELTRGWEIVVIAMWPALYYLAAFIREYRSDKDPGGFIPFDRVVGLITLAGTFAFSIMTTMRNSMDVDDTIFTGLFLLSALAAASHMIRRSGPLASACMFTSLAGALGVVFHHMDFTSMQSMLAISIFLASCTQIDLLIKKEARQDLAVAAFSLCAMFTFALLSLLIGRNYEAGVDTLLLAGMFASQALGLAAYGHRTRSAGTISWSFLLVASAAFCYLEFSTWTIPSIAIALSTMVFVPLVYPSSRFEYLHSARTACLLLASSVPVLVLCFLELWDQPVFKYYSICMGIATVAWFVQGIYRNDKLSVGISFIGTAIAYGFLLAYLRTGVPAVITLAAYPVFAMLLYCVARAMHLEVLRSTSLYAALLSSVLMWLGVHGWVLFPYGSLVFSDPLNFDIAMAVLMLGSIFLLPDDSSDEKSICTILFAVYGYTACWIQTQLWSYPYHMHAIFLQTIPALLIGLCVYFHRQKQERTVIVSYAGALLCQFATVLFCLNLSDSALSLALFFAGAGSALACIQKPRPEWAILSMIYFSLGYISLMHVMGFETDYFLIGIALLSSVHAMLSIWLPEEWNLSTPFQYASVVVTVYFSTLLIRDAGQLDGPFAHYAVMSLLIVAFAYGMMYYKKNISAFLIPAGLAPLIAYYIELRYFEVEMLEWYTSAPGLILATAALLVDRNQESTRAHVAIYWAAILLIAPSLLTALPATVVANTHALWGILLSVGVLLLGLHLRNKKAFFMATSSIVIIVLVKASQFLHLGNLSKGQWGMLIGMGLLVAGALAELARKRMFDAQLEKSKHAYNQFFKDWK